MAAQEELWIREKRISSLPTIYEDEEVSNSRSKSLWGGSNTRNVLKLGAWLICCFAAFFASVVLFPPGRQLEGGDGSFIPMRRDGRVLERDDTGLTYLTIPGGMAGSTTDGGVTAAAGSSTSSSSVSTTSTSTSLMSTSSKSTTSITTSSSTSSITSTTSTSSSTSSTSTTSASTSVLKVFQVSPPVLGPNGILMSNGSAGTNTTSVPLASCQVSMMDFSFASSFGKPFVGNYTPPACIGSSNTVLMNFTVQSKGVQFDRLAIMYFGDTEVFRTSTAEPRLNGIVWEYMKDMSHLMALWKSPQKVIFDLGNQVTSNLTGAFNTTLTATFFAAKQAVVPATMILPISARLGLNSSLPSVFTLPTTNASTLITSFPRNANRAIVSLSTTGQGTEEFWWSNALQSDISTFNSTGGPLTGYSSFREVQLLIDGMMAGVQWPFPVIFTGGVVPAFWSPMVGIDAFDLGEGQVDVTPFLPLLCDGQPHTFTINVVGLNDNGLNGTATASLSQSVSSSWLVSGKIFIWQDTSSTSITTGTSLTINSPTPSITVEQSFTQNSTGFNQSLIYTTSIQRTLTVTSTITTQNMSKMVVTWQQDLSHGDYGELLNFGNIQNNIIATHGRDVALRGVETPYTFTYSYPLLSNSTAVAVTNGTMFNTVLSRQKNMQILGQGSVYPSGLQPFAALPATADLVQTLSGTSLNTTQNGTATLVLVPGNVNQTRSFGTTIQSMRMGGKSEQGILGMEPDLELWFRGVEAVNGSVVSDVMRLGSKSVAREVESPAALESVPGLIGEMGVEVMVGRQAQQGILGL